MLGLAGLQASKKSPDEQALHLVVYDDNSLIGGALLTQKNLILSQIPGPFLVTLVNRLFSKVQTLPGVVGPSATSEIFALLWKKASGQEFKLGMSQKIYELERIESRSLVKGELIQALESHAELVGQWIYEFSCESLPHEPTTLEKTRKLAFQKIQNGDVYLWQIDASDGTQVSRALYRSGQSHIE